MAGGESAPLERARPVLQAFGERIFHTGGPGTGATVKLINNMLAGINMIATMEAMALGAKSGLAVDTLREVIRASSGNSGLFAGLVENIMTVDPQPGFYEVTLNVPVNVQAGETFFIGSDTGTVLTSTLTSGAPGVGYWRRPPQNPNWSMSNVVDHPSYEVLCQGAGQPGGVPSLTADGVPSLGVTFNVELAGAVANAAALLVLGNSDAVWQGAPLPFSLAALGAPGCELLVSGDATQLVTTDGNGEASVPISVPNVTALLDAAFYEQFAVLDPAANSLGFAFSNAGAGVVGH